MTTADDTAVTYTYDANGNNTASSDGRRIAYTTFDKPSSIDKDSHTTAFAYGPDRSQFKRTDTTAITQGTGDDTTTTMLTTTTLYVGSVERIARPNSAVQIKRHIGGVAIETIGSTGGGCTGTGDTTVQYVLRDHLGSVDVLTDDLGSEAQSMSFDAWGRRRNAATWQDLTDAAATGFDHCATTRGFTDHEMLDEVGVVHMNGRIYDPTLARFLQADPFVQFPANLQNHNRYSYVMNNPLSYTDPTGYFLGKLLRPLASIAISIWLPGAGFWTGSTLFAANGIGAVAVSGFIAGAVASGNLEGAAIGAFSAAAFHGIGSISFEGGFAARAGEGVLGTKLTSAGLALKSGLHGAAGGLMSALQGGRFGHGFVSAFATQAAARHVGGLKHSHQRVLAAAVLGGTVSAATGGKFANGAVTGAFSRAFNDELHDQLNDVPHAKLTPEQIKLENEGKVKEFWESRLDSGDPIAELALDVLNDRGFGAFANERLLNFAEQYDIRLTIEEVNVRVMRKHAEITKVDKDGLLTAVNIARYHHEVFAEYGLPPETFGGTPVTGLPGEAAFTGWIWCRECPKE